MVKTCGVPSQVMPRLVKWGVTVIVATTGAVPVFTALKEAILPFPLPVSPIAGVSFTQE
jgi:hypothetical protein